MSNIQMLELKEYLYAANEAKSGRTVDQRTESLRSMLYIHRFDVFTWLMHRGVAIPMELLADSLHPQPGFQSPDETVPEVGK